MSQLNSTRNGCKDVFKAFLVQNAVYAGDLEIPRIAPEEALPMELIRFSKAISRKEDTTHVWVHFYEDDVAAVLVDFENAVVYPWGEDALLAEGFLELRVELDVERIYAGEFLDADDFAHVTPVLGMDAESFQVVDIVFPFGGGEPLRFGNHQVGVYEMRHGLRRIVTFELQEPDRIRKLGIFQLQVQFFPVRLLQPHGLEAFMAREVVGQGHRLDISLDAMRAHELADGDVGFGFRHCLLDGTWGFEMRLLVISY